MSFRILKHITPRIKNSLQKSCIKRHYTIGSDGDSISKPEETSQAEETASIPEDLNLVNIQENYQSEINTEFHNLLNDFIINHDFLYEKLDILKKTESESSLDYKKTMELFQEKRADSSPDGNLKGQIEYTGITKSQPDESYTAQELYLRKLFHAKSLAAGSVVTDAYRPHEDLSNPPNIRQASLSALIAAGAHLGHSTASLRESNQPFIYGIRNGIHLIDLNQTLARLRQVARVTEDIARDAGVILFVGTYKGHDRIVQSAANRAHGYYVHTRWVPGTLTNATKISVHREKVELNMGDETTDRELSVSLKETIIKPDLVVILNPVENRNLLNECRLCRIPTVGIIDTDSESTLVTYAIPANDDSLRSASLIAGIISRAAQKGRNSRIQAFKNRTEQIKTENMQKEKENWEKERLAGIESSIDLRPQPM